MCKVNLPIVFIIAHSPTPGDTGKDDGKWCFFYGND